MSIISPKPLSITQITRAIKGAVEGSFPYPVQVEGEISNYRPHYSGHAYFTLKDEHAQLSAVMWRSRVATVPFPIQDGLKVVGTGNITVYEKTGRYQINLLNLKPAGQGDLQARFEALKQALWEEGLFDAQHKKPIPAYPEKVGLITSPTGAAIRDMISVAKRRNPGVELIVRPAQVQGEKAAPDIINAIAEFNQQGEVDVIILGRGGGSLEDLWAFNDEHLAREIYASVIPIVSGVGHEIDLTIADLVADQRAATPSAAAELVIPPLDEMTGQVMYYADRFRLFIEQKLQNSRQELAYYQSHHAFYKPETWLEQMEEHLSHVTKQIDQQFKQGLDRRLQRVESLQQRLEALHPLNVLKRGFVMVEQDNTPVTQQKALKDGLTRLTFHDGAIEKYLSSGDPNHA